jgi:D-lactate dehydrogenase (cytochrome)
MTTTNLTDELRAIVGADHLSSTEAERDLHSHDESDHPPARPDMVVWPADTGEVSRVVALANELHIPVVGWGAASSTGGHTIPTHGGIVIDFRRMNRVLSVHAEDFQAIVQPGVLRLDLERHLAQFGLFFPPDPGANASVGGMIANNAAGIRAVKYGATSANVLGLEVVLADGRVMKTGSRSIKQSAGYDLTKLFVGSEGTLGLVTQATIRLHPVPEFFATAVVAFPDVQSAAEVVYGIVGNGLAPAALELVHKDHIVWMNEEDGVGLTEATSLLMEFTGPSRAAVDETMAIAEQLCRDGGATGVEAATDHASRTALWRLRHGTRERMRRRFPGAHWVAMDAAVPISKFPELVAYAEERCARENLEGRVVGHAGDGNIHMGLPFDPEDEAAVAVAKAIGSDIIHRAIEMGGTSTGEHGVGLDKRPYMAEEHGVNAIDTMWALKRTLDPNGILNPGKVLPDPA